MYLNSRSVHLYNLADDCCHPQVGRAYQYGRIAYGAGRHNCYYRVAFITWGSVTIALLTPRPLPPCARVLIVGPRPGHVSGESSRYE